MSDYEKLKECINELSDLKKLESASGIPEKDVLFNEIVLNYLIYDNDWFSLDKCGGVITPVKGTFIKDFFRYFTAARGVKFKLFVASVFLNLHWLYKIGLNIFSGKEKNIPDAVLCVRAVTTDFQNLRILILRMSDTILCCMRIFIKILFVRSANLSQDTEFLPILWKLILKCFIIKKYLLQV